MKKYMMAPDYLSFESLDSRTVLRCVVQSASVPTFEAVLADLIYHLTPDEVRCIIRTLVSGAFKRPG